MRKATRRRHPSASTSINQIELLLPRRRISALARASGFERRAARKCSPLAFLVVVVLGYGVEIKRSLSALLRFFKTITGVDMVRSAFQKRFNTGSVAFLRAVFIEATLRHGAHVGRKIGGKLSRFRDVSAIDATVIRLRDFLATRFAACRTNHTKAAAKLHTVLSLSRQVVARVAITSERVGDRACLDIGAWMRGQLLLFDLGYYAHGIFAAIAAEQAFFVSRLKDSANPTIVAIRRGIARGQKAKGKRLWDVDFAEGRPIDLDVRLGDRPDAPIFRLVGVFNTQRHCWHLYVTNLPSRRFSPEEVAEIYRLRWEIELLFKELKSTCRLEQLSSAREEVVLTLLYATLLSLLVTRAIARRAETLDHAPMAALSIRIVSSYLIQHARALAEMLLRGGRSLDSRLNQVALAVLRACRDPNPQRPSVRSRLMR
jgi:putative transposase